MSTLTADGKTSLTPMSRRYRSVTIGLVALMSLVSFEALAVATAMPTVARLLGGVALYALAFGAAMAAGIVCTVISGIWTDATGPRRPLWTGLGLFVLGLTIAGTAGSMPVLVAGRVIQGFGSGLISVALYVIVAETYPSALRPRVFALLAAAWVVPSIVGPLLSGLTVEYLSWRWIFLLIPVLAVPAAAMLRHAAAHRPESSDGTRLGRGTVRTVALALGAGAGTAVFQVGGQTSGTTAAVLLVAACAVMAWCVPRLLPKGTLCAARGLPAVIVLRGLTAGAFACTEVFIPLLLTRQHHLSAVVVGFAVTTGAVFWSLGSWWQARPSLTWSRTRVIQTGTVFLAAGIATCMLLVVPAFPAPLALIGWAACGMGMGLTIPSLSAQTMDLSAPEAQGQNSSALQLSDTTFMAVAVTVTGSLFAALLPIGGVTGYLACFAVALGLAVLAAVAAHRVSRRPVGP